MNAFLRGSGLLNFFLQIMFGIRILSFSDAVILVFDLSNRKSFLELTRFYDECKNVIAVENLPCLLLGNKSDENPTQSVC